VTAPAVAIAANKNKGMISLSKVNEAVACFNDGFNCAQAILSTYCEDFGLDKETALKLSCGFGAGMGRRCETCGAVTGAYMLISLANGQHIKGDTDAKEKTYALIQEFTQKFKEINKSTICRQLLGVDLITGDKDFAVSQVKTVCPKMVRDAAVIVESIVLKG
jgi:C_GCAxxG_C_C family probable redox protein